MNKAALISYFRELTGESDTTVLSDNTVSDTYLQRGAEDLNRRVRFFFKDDAATVDPGAGTAEYALPTDCLEVVFVELGTDLLTYTDLEELKAKEPTWRQTDAGKPEQYYVYGLKVGLYPKPDTTHAALTCTVRYLATPTISTSPGFDLLATQDHGIPCLRAAQLFFEAHGQDADFARADRFGKLFETEAAGVREFYQRRLLQRAP